MGAVAVAVSGGLGGGAAGIDDGLLERRERLLADKFEDVDETGRGGHVGVASLLAQALICKKRSKRKNPCQNCVSWTFVMPSYQKALTSLGEGLEDGADALLALGRERGGK